LVSQSITILLGPYYNHFLLNGIDCMIFIIKFLKYLDVPEQVLPCRNTFNNDEGK
jgi:hypothetical protein